MMEPEPASCSARVWSERTFTLGEGCMEDVRVFYADGHRMIWNINTCTNNLRLTY